MQLFIMRHGEASMKASSDAQRPLTEQGQGEVALMANWLQGKHINFDQIMVSPFLRAQQSADLLLSYLHGENCSNKQNENNEISHSNDYVTKYADKIITTDLIIPSGGVKEVHDYIDGLYSATNCQTVLIVSHMPLVGYLVEELLVDHPAPIFQTAAIAEIDYDTKKMKGHLTGLISPFELT